jgi:hypothetical protein
MFRLFKKKYKKTMHNKRSCHYYAKKNKLKTCLGPKIRLKFLAKKIRSFKGKAKVFRFINMRLNHFYLKKGVLTRPKIFYRKTHPNFFRKFNNYRYKNYK